MIADNQVFFAFQHRQVFFHGTLCPEEEVAQDINGVIAVYFLVPVMDQGCVHFVRIGKGTVAVTDDVCVAKVQVCCVPDQNQFPLSVCCLLYSYCVETGIPPFFWEEKCCGYGR